MNDSNDTKDWREELGVLALPAVKNTTECLLKQQKLLFSQFWKLEVQDQGASIIGLWWGLSSWLINSCLLTVSCYGQRRKNKLSTALLFFLFFYISPYEGTNPTIRGISQRHHLQIPSNWGWGLMNSGGRGTLQAIAFHPLPPKSMSFSHAKHILPIPPIPKVVIHPNINPKVWNPNSHLNIT